MAESSNKVIAEAMKRVTYEIRRGLGVNDAVKKVSLAMKLPPERAIQLVNSVNYRRSALEALKGQGFKIAKEPVKPKKSLWKRILRR